MDARDDLVIQIEILPLHYARQTHAAKIVNGAESLGVHPVGQSIGQVLNNAESVMHRRRAHLDSSSAEQNELRAVLPTGNSADSRDRSPRSFVPPPLSHHVLRT